MSSQLPCTVSGLRHGGPCPASPGAVVPSKTQQHAMAAILKAEIWDRSFGRAQVHTSAALQGQQWRTQHAVGLVLSLG